MDAHLLADCSYSRVHLAVELTIILLRTIGEISYSLITRNDEEEKKFQKIIIIIIIIIVIIIQAMQRRESGCMVLVTSNHVAN